MKKRVLLTVLFVMLLSLLVAFSVSAQEYELVDNLGDPDWYTGNYQYMTDKTSQVVLSNGDGTYTAYPAYYVLKYSITVSEGAVTAASISNIDYSHVSRDGKNYSAGAIYKIELPNGLTTISSGIFGLSIKEPNVTEVVMPDTMTTIGSHAFRGTTNLKKVVFSKNLTKIGEYAFYEAKGLEEFVLPGGSEEYLDVSGANIFYNCIALKEADISTRKIKKLGNNFLSKCTALGKVTLPDTVEEIDGYFLFECYNAYLASDFLPTSLKKIGFQFMSGCKAVNNRVIYFPEGFTGGEGAFDSTYIMATERYKTTNTTLVFLGKITGTIALEQFHINGGASLTLVFTQNNYSDLAGKMVYASTDGNLNYVGKTADTTDTDYFVKDGTLTLKLGNAGESHSKYGTDENGNTLYRVSSSSYQILLCGGDDVEVCYGIRGNIVNSEWNKNITTPFAFDRDGHMTANVHYDLSEIISEPSCGDDGVTEKTCVVCDRVAEDVAPATGNHTLIIIGPCADKCSVCTQYVQRAEQSHTLNEQYAYAKGYLSVGSFDITCTNEGCNHHDVGELNPIFKDFMYSKKEGNVFGLVMVYKVDKEALALYEEKANTKVTFGVLAIAKSNVTSEPLVNNDGTTDYKKIIVANVSEKVPSSVTLLIKGEESQWNQHKDTPFYILGYAMNNGTVEYFQNASNTDVSKLSSIAYADVPVETPSEEEAA